MRGAIISSFLADLVLSRSSVQWVFFAGLWLAAHSSLANTFAAFLPL
jgi:hypothetical protein